MASATTTGASGAEMNTQSSNQNHPDAWLKALAGKFIVFDGPDGSGKSTQFSRLAESARAAGVAVCEVREPGGTEISERIRAVLLDHYKTDMSLRCEMLLYMASRAQLVEEIIRPALQSGQLVLADRFVSSTYAYQGFAGGIPAEEIKAVARVVLHEVAPDLVVIFDADETTAARRMGTTLDRMEAKGREFHRKVRAGFHEQAKRSPQRHLVIDASDGADAIFAGLTDRMRRWVESSG